MKLQRLSAALPTLTLSLTTIVVVSCRSEAPPEPAGGATGGSTGVVGGAEQPTAASGDRGDSATLPASGIYFTDVTAGSGLDQASMVSGRAPSTHILEVKGGGLGLIDIDGDGFLDLLMPNGATLDDPEAGPGARLFRNLGGLRFEDVTESAEITHRRWSFGVAVGDFDGSGHADAYIACFGPDVLLRNRGDGTFEEVAAAVGIDNRAWGTSVAAADLDLDGMLDIYVTNYVDVDPASTPPPTIFRSIPVISGPMGLRAVHDKLFRNNGDGTFTDISEEAGIHDVAPAYGLNVAILDLTGDGLPDIYVGNDSQSNHLFRNVGFDSATDDGRRELRFEEIGVRSGIATNIEGLEQATMGVAIGDVNGNGFPDIFTTNFSSDTNTLHLNLEGRWFDDRTQQYGLGAVSRPYLGWAAGFFDFDHSGQEDLLMVNGHVYPQATRESMDSDYAQPPLLFARRGERFVRVTEEEAGEWLGAAHRDRTAVFADLDHDGDVDVIVGELNGPLRLLRNDAVGRVAGTWLIVSLDDPSQPGNRRGVGGVVTARHGDESQRRWLFGGGPFQSNMAPEVHFGFPAGTETVSLEIRWPDGETQIVDDLRTGRRIVIDRK